MSRIRLCLIWAALAAAVFVPIGAAAVSPLLAFRDPAYIAGGMAGVVALVLLFAQPLLAGNYLPGLSDQRSRLMHRWIGGLLVVAIVVHVAGLWITSPPDVIDALLFSAPTPFSNWGVVAMWAAFSAAVLAALRRRLRLRVRTWRRAHTSLALLTVLGTVIHAILIVGTMETQSKILLCILVAGATVMAVAKIRIPATRNGPER